MAVEKLITTEINVNITWLKDIIYAAAAVAANEVGYSPKSSQTGVPSPKETPWINKVPPKQKMNESIFQSLMKLIDNQH